MAESDLGHIIATCGNFTNGDVPVRLFTHYTPEPARRMHPQSFTEGSAYQGILGTVLLTGVQDENGFPIQELSVALIGSTDSGEKKRRGMSRFVVSTGSLEQLRTTPLEDIVKGNMSLLEVIAVNASRLTTGALHQGQNIRLMDFRPEMIRSYIQYPHIFTSFGRAYDVLSSEINAAFAHRFHGARLGVGVRNRSVE